MTPENDPAEVGLPPAALRSRGQLEPGSSPRHPGDLVAEASLGQLLTVLGCGQRYHRIGVEMVDVAGSSSACMEVSMLGAAPGGPNRSDPAAGASRPRDRRLGSRAQSPHPVQAERRQPTGPMVPRSPPEPFTHMTSTSSPVTGSSGALGRGVTPAVVGVAPVGAETVGALQQLDDHVRCLDALIAPGSPGSWAIDGGISHDRIGCGPPPPGPGTKARPGRRNQPELSAL